MALSRRQRSNQDIWPGFVDALATLLMVIIFLLLIFVVSQLYLNEAIVGRDRALDKLNSKVAELADMLALERESNADLRNEVDDLSSNLRSSLSQRQSLEEQLQQLRVRYADLQSDHKTLRAEHDALVSEKDKADSELEDAYKTIEADAAKIELQLATLANLEDRIEALEALREELTSKLTDADLRLDLAATDLLKREEELAAKDEALIIKRTEAQFNQEQLIEARAEIALMNKQLRELSDQISQLNELLETYEERDEESQAQIADLGKRLNLALANKVQELARYRSEFFGRLREILGSRDDITIVGDRFVFQSEVLFAQGQAELGSEGKIQLARLALTLLQIAATIPPTLDWVLQVNGHTDPVPIATSRFPSNWELSAARAISVVKYLESQGVPAENMSAAGFAEHHPLVEGNTPDAYAKNRRIELKLTQR